MNLFGSRINKTFADAFAEKAIRTSQSRNKRIVRYILCKLEERLGGAALDFDSNSFNLEHILPENPEEGWEEFSDHEVEALACRIGNLTLLNAGGNRDLGNAPYKVKVDLFRTSAFAITRKVSEENADWTPERVANRQNWMAAQATAIWQISQLS